MGQTRESTGSAESDARADDGRQDTRRLVEAGFELAARLEIKTLLVQADEIVDLGLVDQVRKGERVVWLTRERERPAGLDSSRDSVIRIPGTSLSRMSQLKVGLLLATLNGEIELDENILCLSGVARSQRLDTLLLANPRRDFPWFQHHTDDVGESFATREFARIIDIALRFAAQGREGRPIGTIFVLGELGGLAPYLRQLVLNPCEGHPRKNRNIHNPGFVETLREFAALDGAFVVNSLGVVESAGTYLDAPVGTGALRPGMGARHAAAQAITRVADAIAVVISSSSGTVTVFHSGRSVLELEKPQAAAVRRPS